MDRHQIGHPLFSRYREYELVYSTLGIKQIAHKLGFADDADFARLFRKRTGITPTEFRQRARVRLAPPAAGQRL